MPRRHHPYISIDMCIRLDRFVRSLLALVTIHLFQPLASGEEVRIWDNGASAFTDTFTDGDPVDNLTGSSAGAGIAMVVDSQGRAYTAFRQDDGVTGFHLYLIRYDGTDVKIWDRGTSSFTDTFADGDAIDRDPFESIGEYAVAMGVDSLDRIYIIFVQSDGSRKQLYLLRYDGSEVRIWDNNTSTFVSNLGDGDPISTGSRNVAYAELDSVALKIDDNDRVYISYIEGNSPNQHLYLVRYDGTDVGIWDTGTSTFTDTFASGDPIDASAGRDVESLNMVIDSDGKVYIPYTQLNSSSNRGLYLTRFDGTGVGTWDSGSSSFTTTFSDGDPIDPGTSSVQPALAQPAVDSSDRVYFSVTQLVSGAIRPFLMRFDGSAVQIWDNDASTFTATLADGDPVDPPGNQFVQRAKTTIVIDTDDRVYLPFIQDNGSIVGLYLSRYDGTDLGIWDDATSTFTDTFADGDPISRGIDTVAPGSTVTALGVKDDIYFFFVEYVSGIGRLYLTRHTGTSVGIWDNDSNSFTSTFADGDPIDNGQNQPVDVENAVFAVLSPQKAVAYYSFFQDTPRVYFGQVSGLLLPPEMDVQGNSVSIVDGDSTPSIGDHTDFGSVSAASGATSRTFTIRNTGELDLILGGTPRVLVGGAHAADFTVTAQPSTSVAEAGSTTFTVSFDPSGPGVRTATLSIANNDTDEGPYNFSIQGTGDAPEMEVSGNGVSIADGDSSPSVADDTNFGSTNLGDIESVTFLITSSGTLPLSLNGSPRVVVSGSAAFTVLTQPSPSVAASGGTTTFTVRFAPAVVGAHTASVSITNDDLDENPYNFDISGTGVDPLDTDSDGLPDGIDPDDDNDGVTDAQEAADGTDPLDSGSAVLSLSSTFCSDWNGFLGMSNVNEYTNNSHVTKEMIITLYDGEGGAQGSTPAAVTAGAQTDLLVHDLPGFTRDAYGRACTDVSASAPGDIDGRTILYHPNGARYDFAIALPFFQGRGGTQLVQFNTFDPSLSASNPVDNWVTVINDESVTAGGTLSFFGQDGAMLGAESVSLPAGGRRDISAHRFGRNRVGLAVWAPSSQATKFVVRNIRYYYDNPVGVSSFNSAVALEGGAGNGRPVVAVLDKRGGSAILELSNGTENPITVGATFYGAEGSVLRADAIALSPLETTHVIADSFMTSDLGWVQLDGNTSRSVVATTFNYARSADLMLEAAYAMRAVEAKGRELRSSYNTYLGQSCELLLINSAGVEVTSTVTMTRSDGTLAANAISVPTAANSVSSFDLCAHDSTNRYGSVKIVPGVQDAIAALVVRKGANDGYRIGLTAR